MFPISLDGVHAHPKFTSSRDPGFDVAVIQMISDLIHFQHQLHLDDRYFDSKQLDNAHKIEEMNGTDLIMPTPQPSQRCDINTLNNNGVICFVKNKSQKVNQPAYEPRFAVLFTKSEQGTIMIIGVSTLMSLPSDDDYFISVSSLINFINAYSTGHKWGQSQVPFGVAMVPRKIILPSPHKPELPPTKRFVVGLRISKDGQNFCGGALIAPAYVLTAAHCVSDGLAAWASVGSKSSKGDDMESIPITKIFIHPSYGSPFSYSNDVAILELQVPAYASSITLDKASDYEDFTNATMFGYGVVSPDSNELSPVVRFVEQPILSRATCSNVLPNVDESVLCAGGTTTQDACTGDSGSPLVIADTISLVWLVRGMAVGLKVSLAYTCVLAR